MTAMASPILDGIRSDNQLSELINWFKLGHPDLSTTLAFELVEGEIIMFRFNKLESSIASSLEI